jgi:membrane fusion protein, multidrug efflux system
MRIAQAEAALESAKARLELAEIDVKRTTITSPFTARVTSKRIEVGQYVAPGTEWVTIADDSLLEISVPVNANYARKWIEFTKEVSPGNVAWFSAVKPVDCEIRWTEINPTEQCWIGQLHRVGEYDEMSRQVNLVVRVSGEEASRAVASGLPLVAGMFCSVRIPGKTVDAAYRIPDGLLSHEDTVYMAVDGRLRTVAVEVIHRQGDEVLVRGELPEGALLITTRLTNPLENILLDIVREDEDVVE